MEAKQKAVKRDKTFSFNFSKTNENEEKGKGNSKLAQNQGRKKLLPQFGSHEGKLKNILIPMKYKEKLNHL